MADFDFERGQNWKGVPSSTLNLDHDGKSYPYETVRTWEFYAFERDHEHGWKALAEWVDAGHDGALYFERNRPDKGFYWTCDYNYGESVSNEVACGFADSLEECEQAFMELWPTIRKYKGFQWTAIPEELDHHVSEMTNRKVA